MKHIILLLSVVLLASCSAKSTNQKEISLTKEELRDKIAGGWAGKMIGVTYGAPTEFKALGCTYEDSITWTPEKVGEAVWQDDIYVQLTFMETMDKYGMDAPADKFLEDFATAGYMLWHANVQARKNYYDGIFPPQSGHPDNNLHADDIDFQIEADYLGFMNPAMPNTAMRMADKIGHIMNYGDGVYGGIYLAALYSEAFVNDDIEKVVEKALLSLPQESNYYKIVRDVTILHRQYPNDWRKAWKELQDKWGTTQICEGGTLFNIDAKLNGAFIVMGLLYGEGDFNKTMEISTRCGQDSDCNPSSAVAVLGVMKGFKALPEDYRKAVEAVGDSLFINTTYSFNRVVDATLAYAEKSIVSNGGKSMDDKLVIRRQQPEPAVMEDAFPKLVFSERIPVSDSRWKADGVWKTSGKEKIKKETVSKGSRLTLTFTGNAVSLSGDWVKTGGKANIYVDGQQTKTIDTYFNYANQEHRNISIFHILNLSDGEHTVCIEATGEKNEDAEGCGISVYEAVVYKQMNKNNEDYKFSFQ